MKETEKIGSLITSDSPTLMSHVVIATILSADVRTSRVVMATLSSAHSSTYSPFLIIMLTLLSLAYCILGHSDLVHR